MDSHGSDRLGGCDGQRLERSNCSFSEIAGTLARAQGARSPAFAAFVGTGDHKGRLYESSSVAKSWYASALRSFGSTWV